MTDQSKPSLCGYVAIVGRPNVGKSTLMNHLIKQKISITSRKPQTTRFNVTGIKTENHIQMIFVDTPGMHSKEPRAINRYMNRAAQSAAAGVDVVVFVVDRLAWTEEDDAVWQRIKESPENVIVCINKIDKFERREELIPYLAELQNKLGDVDIVPLSALKSDNLDSLEKAIAGKLPEAPHFFEEDQITDKSSRFLVSEIIREKLMRQLGAELPYQLNVEIEEFAVEANVTHISALVLVEKEGQKRILIGDKGSKLKSVGQAARKDMEILLDSKIMLKLWVKVKSGWSDDERALKSLGYFDS